MTKRINPMLIIIPFDLPWEHTADYAHQTAYELSKNHIVICYMQKEAVSIREYLTSSQKQLFWKAHSENMFLYYPLYVVPFRRFEIIERVNTWINILCLKVFVCVRFHRLKFFKKLLWMFYPDYEYMVSYFGTRFDSIYDCVDFHGSRSEKAEDGLITRCRYFFVNSFTLFTHHQKKRPDVVLVPQGFRLDVFRKPISNKSIISFPQPIIGYVGGINDRLDMTLLFQLAQKMSRCSFLFVGPKQNMSETNPFERLRTLPNVHWIDAQPKEQMPSIIDVFDIAMIPYDARSIYNRNCYPMKLFEYFYMGKPVISMQIDELKRFSKLVKIRKTVQEWEDQIMRILSSSWPESNKKEQRRLAIANSWEKKIHKILQIIESGQPTRRLN